MMALDRSHPKSGRSTPLQYTRKRERTRVKILTAATAVLARSGLDGATVGAVADEAGVVPGTVYHHFDSRETLIEAVTDELASGLRLDMQDIRHARGGPEGQVALAAVGLVDRAVRDHGYGAAFGHLIRRVPQLASRLRSDVELVVRDGLNDGTFVGPTADGGVPLLVDALLGIAANAALAAGDGRLSIESREAVAQIMLSALGLPQDEARRVAGDAVAGFDQLQNQTGDTRN